MSNVATAIAAGKIIIRYGQKAVKYLKDDYSHWTGLNEPVTIAVNSKGIGLLGINFKNDTLEIVTPDADNVILHAEPFPSSSHYWNLASIINDAHEKGGCDDGRDEASLFHDLIAEFRRYIAMANRTSEKAVSDWSDKLLAIIWRNYGAKKGKAGWWLNFKTWFSMNAAGSRLKGLWGSIAHVVVLCAMSLALFGFSGCVDVPEGSCTTPDIHYTTGTNTYHSGGSN